MTVGVQRIVRAPEPLLEGLLRSAASLQGVPHVVDANIDDHGGGLAGEHVPIESGLEVGHLITADSRADHFDPQGWKPGGEFVADQRHVATRLIARLGDRVAQKHDPLTLLRRTHRRLVRTRCPNATHGTAEHGSQEPEGAKTGERLMQHGSVPVRGNRPEAICPGLTAGSLPAGGSGRRPSPFGRAVVGKTPRSIHWPATARATPQVPCRPARGASAGRRGRGSDRRP